MSTDQELIDLLRNTRTIAVVGLSPKPDRASYRVAAYLQAQGYTIVPVRPGGGQVLGETCHASLKEIPKEIRVDLVDVFRRAEDTPPIATAAVAIGAKGFWLQSGIVNDAAMTIARQAGLAAIQDLCLMVEHRRLAGKL
ncbi:MAG: CoA-binding protein [Magnetococcales bacterium]|nr:CoA-binding protein [Magnetococcales bacterium]